MAVSALIIGIGGTGQWVLTYLKKDLKETYGGIPKGVKLRAFDTVKTSRAQAGGQAGKEDQDHVEERTVGGVKLKSGEEYIHLGGYVRDYVRDIAQDGENRQYPHLRSWFQAKYYLDNLSDQQFNLDEGAGMFRQFGRLALFHDLKASTVAKVYGQLMDTVQLIQREMNTQNLYVFVVGSLAGGTGAGMFVDVAHLVRQIAKAQAKIEVNVRGFLVLPDAFGTLSAEVRRGMNARAFASMRENKRFSVNFDWDLGYPMPYAAPTSGRAGDPVLLGAIKGQLFDHLYYIDGHRDNFPLYAIPLENGVAPTVADMISAVLDEYSSGSLQEHTRNLQSVPALRGVTRKIPYYGGLGTYSVVFPIYHIIQGYAHRLSLEALQQMLQPSAVDNRTGLPTRLAGDKNKEAGEGYTGLDAARAFLTSSSIIDPNNPTNAVDNTLLTADLVDFAERFTPADMSIVDTLAGRALADWDRINAPTGQSEDVLNARQRAEAVLSVKLVTEVPPSKAVTPRERPADGMYRIENGVRSHKNIYLGAEQKETGQRVGGKYREALGEYANVHLKRFQKMLDYKMREVLNGRSNADPIQAKSGKLGHLQEFLEGVSSYLDRGYQVMTRVMERRRSQAYGRMQAIAAAQNALNEMKANANDTRLLVGKAYKSQDAYLEAEQILIDIHKVEIMEQAVTDTIKQMQEMVASAKASADGWAQTLGIGQGSLYAALLAGKRQVDANRDKDADVECRLVLGARKAGKEEDAEYKRFRKYEEQRFKHYAYEGQVNQVAALLGDLNWQVSTEVKAGKPVFKLGLNIASEASAKPDTLGDSTDKNLGLFLGRAQQAFKDANKDESVIGYLMHAYESPEALAELIHARSGPLLKHDATNPIPANYLRAAYGQESGQADYLRGMLRRLASLSSITDMDKFAKLVNSENRFACTLVHTVDLIELNRMKAFTEAEREYTGYTGERGAKTSQRSILHCFPAEVNAVRFEERLPLLNQAMRMLHDDIVLQLEKEDNLRLFLFCWGYRLINTYGYDEGGQSKVVYRLQWKPSDERSDLGEVWLTKPEKDPELLDALMTFNYVGRDVGHGERHLAYIAWDRVRSTLDECYQDDMMARRTAGTLGMSDPALQGWLVEQKVPEDDAVWLLAARLDRLSEMDKKLTEMVVDLDKQLKTPANREDEDLQKQYDLASVFVLTVRDEQEQLKRRIRGRQRDIQPGPTAPKLSEKGKKPSWDF